MVDAEVAAVAVAGGGQEVAVAEGVGIAAAG